MTLSTSTVLGNYTHSEPKFIGASPERKDYPFNTGIYGVKLLNDSNQISTIAPTHSVNIGTPETFKIGDRVRVNEITDPARPDVYKNLSNEFGVVQYVGDICATVEFPQLSDPIWVIPFGSLRKEFTVGDRVKTQEGRFGYITAVATSNQNDGSFTNQYHIQYDDPISGPDSTRFANVWGEECLTYSPKENGDVHQVSVKFITAAGDDTSSIFDEGHTNTSMKKIFEKCYGPQTTYAATIVLASGRVVDIPAPDPEKWKLSYMLKAENNKYATLSIKAWKATDIALRGVDGYGEFQIEHDEGRCWLSDMARIINQKEEISPFETRFSYISEVREYVRKPLETPAYECTMPALRCLW